MSENEEKVTDLGHSISVLRHNIYDWMATTTRQIKKLHDRVRELEDEILVMRSEKIALETVSTLLHKTTPDDVDSTRD